VCLMSAAERAAAAALVPIARMEAEAVSALRAARAARLAARRRLRRAPEPRPEKDAFNDVVIQPQQRR